MKLIPEELIEETASEFSHYATEQYGFKEGVRFAENQIQPLIVEFAEWIDMYYQRSLSGKWRGIDVPVCDTTQQLLEEFIEFKNKQK